MSWKSMHMSLKEQAILIWGELGAWVDLMFLPQMLLSSLKHKVPLHQWICKTVCVVPTSQSMTKEVGGR